MRNGTRALFRFFLVVLFLPCGTFLAAETDGGYLDLLIPERFSFPENYTVRKNNRDLLLEDYFLVRPTPSRVSENGDAGQRVRVRVDEQNGFFYILFINEKDYAFPLYSNGSYIVKRRQSDGETVQVKVFLCNDESCFIRITPHLDRVKMTITMYGHSLYSDVLIPMSMERVMTAPLGRIIDMTDDVVDWDLIFGEEDRYSNRMRSAMIREIRNGLFFTRDTEDGAQDSRGEFVFIETLNTQAGTAGFNCSGFAKWIIDGLYFPLTGEYTRIGILKEMQKELRGNRWSDELEEERDPYFGLDWTRNLAVALRKARYGEETIPGDFADVKDIPFISYSEDVGFKASDLKIVLYILSRTEPGYFYLASVSTTPGIGDDLRQHHHVAVLFPEYTEEGGFSSLIFERNVETDLESFIARYSAPGREENVHLVRVPLLEDFELPLLNIVRQ